MERGTSLRQKDIKYGNSAIYTLCHEILKVCSNEGLEFMKECLKNTKEFDDCNKKGFSIRTLINERGTEALKQLLIE